jgi:hypothetical protein
LPLAQVSGDEAIATAHDAAWILRLYAGLVDALPVSKSEVPPPAASPAVHLGEPSRRLDGLWELPLVLLDAGDVLSGEISLAYDADVVAIQEMRVEEPAFTTAHATGEGRVAFAFAAATSPAERFVLARLTAGSQATAAELFDHVRIESVELNEGQLSTSLLSPRPAAYALYPPNPNPFNSSVALRFGLPEAGPVEVLLFNAIGQRVATLASDTREAGIYRLTWDGRDAAGRAMASGVYLVQLQAGARRLTTKVTLLR